MTSDMTPEFMTPDLVRLETLLSQGSLTCDLSDADADINALPLTFSWRSNRTTFLGPAHTVNAPHGDLDAVYQGIRTAKAGCVLVVATGGGDRASWGETTTREALRQGVRGVILDGACRDVPMVRVLGLPVVARGVSPKRAARTNQGDVGQPLELGGLMVHPSDLIVSDENGTVIVPHAHIKTLAASLTRSTEVDKEH